MGILPPPVEADQRQDGAFAFEVNDGSAFALTGSQNMPRMIERLFPLPVRFRQIFAQQWKSSGLFAWLPIAPPGHIALGMVFTSSGGSAFDCENERPVRPEIWCERPSVAPKMAWSNEGSGGAPCSIWRVNSLGMCYAKVGFDAPRPEELWDIKRGNLIPAEAFNSIRVERQPKLELAQLQDFVRRDRDILGFSRSTFEDCCEKWYRSSKTNWI